jgi:multidrug efflux pump subunit AcrA (membrane-fusion protein)
MDIMAFKRFTGTIWSDVIEVRFATSGKITHINKTVGDYVKKGEMLAGLDKKLRQADLDRQLADYEKQRAEFEIFNLQPPNETAELVKYLKVRQQASLNSSVKEVEIVKMNLDQLDLFCPVNGQILDAGGNVAGLYVTPASSVFKISNLDTLRFRIEVDQEDLDFFTKQREIKVKNISGIMLLPRPDSKLDKFIVDILLTDTDSFIPGTRETISISAG